MTRWIMTSVLLLMLLTGGVISAQDNDSEPVIMRDGPPDAGQFALETVMDGFRRPLYLTHAGDDSGRLFLLEQGGVIYVMDGETYERSIFLDVSDLVSPAANSSSYTEQGLLGLAFAPDYADSGTFYINYTDRSGHTAVARYQVSDDPDVADPASAEIIFTQVQPFPNHNGGHIDFGPDGYLYVSLGDGGAANDPLGAGQDITSLLGTILRLDVNTDSGYGVPDDNPFVESGTGAPEIWSYGLRNVWRFSFDRATGDMYLGDVGQNQWEEINFQPADSPGGENYGWNAYEATHVFNQGVQADDPVMPIAEYDHSQGCSVTGGYVYRGESIPTLTGTYLYSDYCSGNIWYAYRDTNMTWQSEIFLRPGIQVSSFGEDESGELYIINYSGSVLKLVPA